MSFQLFYFFTLICVLSQTNAHFGTSDDGGRVGGSLIGDLLRAGGNVKYQLADVSDNAANRIRSMFHKKTPNASFGVHTGYVIQAAPYGNTQPPVGSYGTGAGGRFDGNIGYNIGVAPASSYDPYRPSASSGIAGGHVNTGASLSSASSLGTVLDEDHLEYVSSTGVRRRLSYEEVVQLIMAVVDSSKLPTGSGFTGRYTGVAKRGYTGG